MPSDKDLRQAEYFRNRIVKNEKALRRWARREGIEALRLYDRDIPEVPLALDRYGDELLMALYERPYEKDEELEEEWLSLMSKAAAEALGLDGSKVHRKKRKRQRGEEQYEKLSREKEELRIREGGLSFIVNLSDYLDTGLFLDHRITRALVRSQSEGKRVLNLFSYTGSFSVYSASGGASETTSVDLSSTYLSWARRNLELNGFSPERHRLIRSDVASFLSAACARGEKWELIVVDPPTFSNSKASERDFDIAEDWPALLGACMRVLALQGVLYFSTNSRRLKWSEAIAQGISGDDRRWEDLSAATIPPDFRDAKIHRCWRAAPRC
jgi:23S rRNA G2069 N7-methylase RlmK/C1962 C5-methylase RlmI